MRYGNIQCVAPCCKEFGAASLCSEVYCVLHFIAYCYDGLDSCEGSKAKKISGEDAEMLLQFLRECSRRTADLCFSGHTLDNSQRGRLLDILLRVDDLACDIRVWPEKSVEPGYIDAREASELAEQTNRGRYSLKAPAPPGRDI
ncbi:MAG: hypothetical protein PVS2B2_00800 [Candidatus Acidiferrum sp.]